MAKKKSAELITLLADVTIEAGSADGKSLPKFSVLAYTGGAMNVNRWSEPVVVDLAGLTEGKSIKANLDHESNQRVGHVTEVHNDGKSLTLNGVVSAKGAAADEVVANSESGYPWQASIEVAPGDISEVVAGKSVTVNGQTIPGPVMVARTGTLKGFAFVSHGADDNTVVKIAAIAAQEKNMDPELKAFIEEMLPEIDVSTLSASAVTNLRKDFEGKSGKRKSEPISGSDFFVERKLERDRVMAIREVTNKFLDMRPNDIEAIERMHDHAIESKMTPQDFRCEMYDSTIPLGRTPIRSKNELEMTASVLQAAICMSGRLTNLDKEFDDKTLQTAHTKFGNGIGLKQLYRIVAKARGWTGEDDEVTLDMHRIACNLVPPPRGYDIQASGFSTLSIPGILGNVAGKFLLEGWGGGEQVWRAITDVQSVRDFKQITNYRLSGSLKYEKVGAGGEIKHGTVSEDSYTGQADTYGKMFAVTRTDIINDDLGAITRIPLELGYGANDSFNEVFWTEFLNNSAFFASGNNNLATGVFGTLATTIPSLVAAEAIWMAQTKPNGQPLGMLPSILLVPPLSYRNALSAMQSTLVVGTSGPTPDANTFRNAYAVYTSPFMATSSFTGYSTIKWYLLANRPGFSTMLTVFLNGRDAPVVETDQAEFSVLGMQMRGYHDFGTKKMEYRAGVQGSGA